MFLSLKNLNWKLLLVLPTAISEKRLYFLAPKLVHISLLYKRNAFNFANRNPPIALGQLIHFSVSQDMRNLQVKFW